MLICVLIQGNWLTTVLSVIDKCAVEELSPGLFTDFLSSAHHKFFRAFVFKVYLPSCSASRQRFASPRHLCVLRWKHNDLRLGWQDPEANDRPVSYCFRWVVNRELRLNHLTMNSQSLRGRVNAECTPVPPSNNSSRLSTEKISPVVENEASQVPSDSSVPKPKHEVESQTSHPAQTDLNDPADPYSLRALKQDSPADNKRTSLIKQRQQRKVKKYYNRQNALIDAYLSSADEEANEVQDMLKNGGKVRFAVNASFVCNFCLFVIQLYAAISTGSLSLFATAADAFVRHCIHPLRHVMRR